MQRNTNVPFFGAIMSVEDKLRSLSLELPTPPLPVGSYIPVQVIGNLAFVSGQTARIDGVRRYLGKVGREVTPEDAYLSARDASLNCLAALKQALGDLDRIKRIIKVLGFVNSAPGFNQQPSVINGCSELLLQLYGQNGPHARSAVGVAELPFGASVEIEMIVEVA
jgi:enamine deaminase RidA (YjgF/YER057c/UK114 family)